jgi:hypothetical protein
VATLPLEVHGVADELIQLVRKAATAKARAAKGDE